MALSGSKSYTLTIGDQTLNYHYRETNLASESDASSHAEALPTLSISLLSNQGP